MARIAPELAAAAITLGEAAISEQAPETGATFEENARQKAAHYGARAGVATVAEDSGLCIDAFGGGPGVGSARFLPELHDAPRNRWIARELANRPQAERGARYVCVLALWTGPKDEVLLARGEVAGVIAPKPRGTQGFGYDPIFLIPAIGRTFGEMTPAEKDRSSHRGRAIEAFLRLLERRPDLKELLSSPR